MRLGSGVHFALLSAECAGGGHARGNYCRISFDRICLTLIEAEETDWHVLVRFDFMMYKMG